MLYEDGEREAGVAEALISKRAAFAVGAAVEANYREKGTYYPGRITAMNEDGTFGVLYDDGEGELGVVAAQIRPKAAPAPEAAAPQAAAPQAARAAEAPSPAKKRPATPKEPLDSSDQPLSPGMAVEARFRGRGKVYQGKLLRRNEDGSCAVMYDDGDVDEALPREMVRAIEGAPRKPLAPTNDNVVAVAAPAQKPAQKAVTPAQKAQTATVAPTTPAKKVPRRARPKPTESVEGDALKVMRPTGAKGGGGAGGVAFLPGGAVVCQAHRSRACLWVARSAAHVGDVAGHTGRVMAVACCALEDDILLLTGGSDGAACVWRFAPGPPAAAAAAAGDDAATLECWQKTIHRAAARDGNAKLPKTVRLGGDDDPATDTAPTTVTPVARKPALTLTHPRGAWVLGVDISARGPPGALAVTAATDGVVRLWDAVEGGAPVRMLTGHSWYATAVTFRPGFPELASASMDKTVRVWRYEEEDVGHLAPPPSPSDNSTAASSRLELLEDDDEVSVETPLAPAPHTVLRLDMAPKALAWSRDGALLLAAGEAPTPVRFDCRGARPVKLPQLPGAGHRGAVVQIAISADGSSAWTASHDGSCRCWALRDENDRGGLVHALSCARTGGRIVGVAIDQAALGLDATGERRARARVATATADGALRLWPAPQTAVSEADATLRGVAAGGDAAVAAVAAALLDGGDGQNNVDPASAAWAILPTVRAVARRVPRASSSYAGKGAAAKKRDARRRDLAATAGAAQRLAFAVASDGGAALDVARAAAADRGLLRAACEAVAGVDGGGVKQLMAAALANDAEKTPASP